MKALALALLVACTPAQRTATLAVTSSALIVADWHQTQGIVAECQELNPLVGRCGERIAPNAYFPLVLAASITIGLLLGDWGETWFGAVTGAQGATVWSNYRIGDK